MAQGVDERARLALAALGGLAAAALHLVRLYAGHDLVHLRQIERIAARQV